MEVAFGIDPFAHDPVQETSGGQVLTIQFVALQNDSGFTETDRARTRRDRRQAGGASLVDFTARMGPAKSQGGAVAGAEKRKRETIETLGEAVRVPLRSYKDDRHALVPQISQRPPGRGHGVVVLKGAGGDEEILVADEPEHVIREGNALHVDASEALHK